LRLLFDCETNGLLDRRDLRILCGAATDLDTGEEWTFDDTRIGGLYELVREATELLGHNIADFDIPLLDRFAPPGWTRTDRFFDTLRASQQMFPNLVELSARLRNTLGRTEAEREERYPRKFLSQRGIHGLHAWGYRLGFLKGELLDVDGVQESFSQPLLDYCLRDVQLNVKVFERLREKGCFAGQPAPDYEAMVIESQVAWLLGEMRRNGVGFNFKKAVQLYSKLAARRDELAKLLKDHFKPWYIEDGNEVKSSEWCHSWNMNPAVDPGYAGVAAQKGDAWVSIPKRSYKVAYPNPLAGREEGCAFTKIKLVEFNPGSTAQIADRLQKLYGWKPKEWTDSGLPKMDDAVLSDLDYPPVPMLVEYLMVEKRLGQIGDGKQAWLKVVTAEGKIHGNVRPSGARTSRCTHSGPNLAQVPRVTSPYGPECRELFQPTREGWVQVGVDASGIELRKLAHRLAKWDGGAFAELLLRGDPHTDWMTATGIFIRDNQKTETYAFLYGAGDEKLGKIILEDWRTAYTHKWILDEKGKKKLVPCPTAEAITQKPPPSASYTKELGAAARRGLLRRVIGLDPLLAGLRMRHKQGWLTGLDGRHIQMDSPHGALNDLLQSDAAIAMKHAWWILYCMLTAAGFVLGVDYAFMLNVHDEWQVECKPEHADTIGKMAVAAIVAAGEKLKSRCPLDGEYKVGMNWKETH
jgi:DNA polymerase I